MQAFGWGGGIVVLYRVRQRMEITCVRHDGWLDGT